MGSFLARLLFSPATKRQKYFLKKREIIGEISKYKMKFAKKIQDEIIGEINKNKKHNSPIQLTVFPPFHFTRPPPPARPLSKFRITFPTRSAHSAPLPARRAAPRRATG